MFAALGVLSALGVLACWVCYVGVIVSVCWDL